jgi:hypothetical protein
LFNTDDLFLFLWQGDQSRVLGSGHATCASTNQLADFADVARSYAFHVQGRRKGRALAAPVAGALRPDFTSVTIAKRPSGERGTAWTLFLISGRFHALFLKI